MKENNFLIFILIVAFLIGIATLLETNQPRPIYATDKGETWKVVEDFSSTKEGWHFVNGTWVLWTGGWKLSFPASNNGTLYLIDYLNRDTFNNSEEIRIAINSLIHNDNTSVPCVKKLELDESPKIITLYCQYQ